MTTFEFTAFSEEALLEAGSGNGSKIGVGDSFTMPTSADLQFAVKDDDNSLSGDCRDQATDHSGQTAGIMDCNGDEVGNGKQIYAEKYYWVHDDAGNWYVMINIEQEHSGEDYFTFYTGHGYETPPAGAELTVYSCCNVRGDWVDYKCLDAGEKDVVETGSISGRVFCDDDCDGVDGAEVVVEGCDYVIEAENMHSWGFETVHGAQASGGELARIRCLGEEGALKTTFDGKDGVYDFSLFIQDECDGQSEVTLLVNGQVVKAIRLDRDGDGGGSNNGGFSEFVIDCV